MEKPPIRAGEIDSSQTSPGLRGILSREASALAANASRVRIAGFGQPGGPGSEQDNSRISRKMMIQPFNACQKRIAFVLGKTGMKKQYRLLAL